MSKRTVRTLPGLFLLVFLLQACSMPGTSTPTPMLGDPPLGPLTLYVSTTGNDSNDCLSEAAPCQTIYRALALSTPGSTILIGPGEFTRNGPLTARHDVTLVGAGIDQTTLSRSSGDVVQLTSPGSRVTIRGVTIDGAGPDASRNGIEVRSGVTLILEDCLVRDHYYGLRVFEDGAVAQVNNVCFEGSYYGVLNRGALFLGTSIFTGNLIALANYGSAEVDAVTFDGNGHFAADSGAASPTIDNGSEGALTVRGGRISNAAGYGIIVHGGTVLLEGVEVYANQGIAIWHQQGLLEVRSSVIRDNAVYGIAVGGRRGAPDIGTVNVHETAVVRNRSAGVRIDGGDVTLQNVTVSGNTATSSGGGGIWMYGGNLFLLNSTVAFNTGHGIEAGPGDEPAVITIRRSIVSLNSTEECLLDPRVTISHGTLAIFVCAENPESTLGLGPLTSEAGTLVHPLLAGSALIDAGGPVALCATVDQRGYGRPAGSTCDIGAYEFGTTLAAIVLATPDGTQTPEIVPLVTSTPSEPVFTFLMNANCRKGPGVRYDVETVMEQDLRVNIIGRNELADWWLVLGPDAQTRCWVSETTGEGSGAQDGVPVESAEPLPATPVQFTAGQAICSPNLNDRLVPLVWSSGGNTLGFRLYRNNVLLETLGMGTLSYEDHAPKGSDLFYELEAYNSVGVSERSQLNLAACP